MTQARAIGGRRVLGLVALLLLGGAVLGVGNLRAAPETVPVEGIWECDGRLGKTRVVFALDHNWVYRFEGPETYRESYGAWSVDQDVLEVRRADRRTVTWRIKPQGVRTMLLVDGDGAWITLRRSREPAPPTVAPRSPWASPFENRPLRPRLRNLRPSDTGHILYTRVEVVEGVPRPRIHVMDGDGSHKAPFVAPEGAWSADDPAWSPDGKRIAFASSYEDVRSALYQDLFVADLETGRSCRITGNEVFPVANPRTGIVRMRLGGRFQDRALSPGQFEISIQGTKMAPITDEVVTEHILYWDLLASGFPVGRPFWIKFWRGKHLGSTKVYEIPGPTTEEDPFLMTFDLNEGTTSALRPCFTPDGKRLLCTWHSAFTLPKPPSKRPKRPDELEPPDLTPRFMGSDAVALIDVRKGTPPLVIWEVLRANGQAARSPTVSPDGRWIAFEIGEVAVQGLAFSTMDDFLAQRYAVRMFARGGTTQGAGKVSHADPAWSPDGRHVAFCSYLLDLRGGITGSLQVVTPQDGKVREIQRFGRKQIPTRPSWSPDGSRLAFALVTGKGPFLSVLDLARLNVTSDVVTIRLDGSGLRALTSDGRSGAPAWGP